MAVSKAESRVELKVASKAESRVELKVAKMAVKWGAKMAAVKAD